MALITMATLTMATLTMATLTMAALAMAALTMATLTKATRFCDDLLYAILRSYRIAAASQGRGGGGDWEADPEDI